MRWRVKRAVKTVIVPLIAVGAIASVPPSMWREAEDALHRHLRSVEMMARPAAERSADWFERQTRALRDRFGEAQVGAGKSAEARTQEMVRVVRAAGAFTGAARVIDGDTLDVGGVRIRLHGIDAPESEQSCRAGGRRWSCGREATRALAGRIGKRTVGCQERDRDRYGRSWRCVAPPGWISMRGWSRRAGPSPTGGTRMHTLPRSRRHVRQGAACGAGKSYRRGIGGKGSAWGERGRRLSNRAGGAASKATSARTARASTTCRPGVTTIRLESTCRRGSGGSAPRARHERRDGAARGNSPRGHGAAHRRPRVRRAATVAVRWNRAPRSVPDSSRGADATLLEPIDPDSRPEERPV